MSQHIKTYKDLCDEREKLKTLLEVQKQQIRKDWTEFKEEFAPVKHAMGVVGKMARPDKSNPLVNAGLALAGDIFLRNFVLAKAGWVTKLAVPFVVKNYTSHFLVDKGVSLIGKVANFFKGKRKSKQTETAAPKKSENYYSSKRTKMNDKDNKVVNTEEQNRAVNPGSGDYQEISPKEHVGTNQNTINPQETEKSERRSESERRMRNEED